MRSFALHRPAAIRRDAPGRERPMTRPASETAVRIDQVSHRYGERPRAQQRVVGGPPGEIFGLLGPNGGGKTTLFRLLCTILPLQSGAVSIFGRDLVREADAIRWLIGVTFQSPSLDPKLSVGENLVHQGRLYGLTGSVLRGRIDDVSRQLTLTDRLRDRAETLSGGLKRRVEIAKSLLHSPQMLILDEPSTGLDVGGPARHVGALPASCARGDDDPRDDAPDGRSGPLRPAGDPRPGEPRRDRHARRTSQHGGGDCLTIPLGADDDGAALARRISERFGVEVQRLGASLRIEHPRGAELLRDLVLADPESIRSITLGKPTLEDVFVRLTGRQFESEPEPKAKPGAHPGDDVRPIRTGGRRPHQREAAR
ncbi:MAG: ABC transporter ATP-binding protein [Pirellulales bacterium]